ncbi:MAG: transcriptional repressor [Rhodospirillales bacterium]|nr:transcriptional repressor [Rhodospirillales bacterium]
MTTPSRIEEDCVRIGLKMTPQRRVIARVLTAANDHPDVEELWRRAAKIDPRISIATVYRTVRLLEASEVLKRHDFGDGRARYERVPDVHHDHLIDVRSGKVIEFQNKEIEVLQEKIAEKHGYRLIGHRLELYCAPLDDTAAPARKRKPV